jgi:2-keto-4-pentenoate hydratase/2-oxohepta-3-ene-1,7-dioic acid hydratase in catechol pathway
MHLIRYEKNGQIRYGYLEGEMVGAVEGDIFGDFVRGGLLVPLAEVRLLAPCQPSKIIAVSYNYSERLRELGLPPTTLPPLAFKAPSSVCGPGAAIQLPPQSQNVQFGAELAVVMGKRARWVSPEAAAAHILGYTCANDVLAVDVAEIDQGWARASSFDTFCPLGPSIATHVDPTELRLTCTVNNVTRQIASTLDMLFTVPQVIAFVSAGMTLLPGDVILMGTPAGCGPLAHGDVVEVKLEHVGEMRNTVVEAAEI